MATSVLDDDRGGAFLLELLHFAGWRLQVRDDETATIRARRGDVELEVSGSSLAEAAGIVFARAMRSSKRKEQKKDRRTQPGKTPPAARDSI
jgi:hypothetical protein